MIRTASRSQIKSRKLKGFLRKKIPLHKAVIGSRATLHFVRRDMRQIIESSGHLKILSARIRPSRLKDLRRGCR